MVTINPTEKIGMSLQDFMRLQAEQPFELLFGERVDKIPSPLVHSLIIRFLFLRLNAFATQHELGEVFQETTYAELDKDKSWVEGARIPDVMSLSKERVREYTSSPDFSVIMPFGIAPDLTVEVLSPSEKAVDINRKVKVDRGLGVRLIWIVDPFQKIVVEHTLRGTIRQLELGSTLEGADVLPGFALPLAELFEACAF
ncbi:Uma2 family endonuclease [Aggregatilineales bacterium SYSU G02658]